MIFTETRSAIFAPVWPTMYIKHSAMQSSALFPLNKGSQNTEDYVGMC